jgi:hypothetical protein
MILTIATVLAFGSALWRTFVVITSACIADSENIHIEGMSRGILFSTSLWTLWYALTLIN